MTNAQFYTIMHMRARDGEAVGREQPPVLGCEMVGSGGTWWVFRGE